MKYENTQNAVDVKIVQNLITTYPDGCVQSEGNEWMKSENNWLSQIKDIRKQILMLKRPYNIQYESKNYIKIQNT